MASSTASNYIHNALMGHVLKAAPYTAPTSLWVALFTTVPALTGTGGVEVSTSGTNYGRVQIVANSGWAGPSGTNQEYTNAADLSFLVPTANWGTITGAGLYDASTGGNLTWIAVLTTPKVVNNGDGAPRILASQLRISRAVC
ncbi:head protein [Acidovorax phage ACP17]|uniref:Uncharacterized protein n=1 Tax=Acidovorax phage ACP17 TaxID=2010329 RepID=A0A223AIZ9_9CAUD|nr:head protein [Acidovorax phage ACP17]ASS33928.1 hypothetical protein [Acidovorax phage ACP17]